MKPNTDHIFRASYITDNLCNRFLYSFSHHTEKLNRGVYTIKAINIDTNNSTSNSFFEHTVFVCDNTKTIIAKIFDAYYIISKLNSSVKIALL